MARMQSRHLLPELMDQPGLAQADHRAALAGLERVNRLTRSSNMLGPSLEQLARRRVGGGRLRVVDIACGGGDVTCAIAARAARANLDLEICGCDLSPVAVSYAEQRAARAAIQHVQFFVHDILADELPDAYDAAICSLFLHHLDRDDALLLLNRMGTAAQFGVFISDLRRTSLGYAMAYVGTRLLSRSRIVHYDGPQSVAGAFTSEEALALAHQAGWSEATVRHQWPQRFLLSWDKTCTVPHGSQRS